MDNIIEYYNTEVAKLKEKRLTEGQGAVRDGIGNIYQNVAQMLIESVDPTLVCKHNDYLTKYSPSGKFKVDNIQVDLHVYKDDKLIFILESKTYLDACFLKRAVEDFREIRGIVGDIPAIIWAGQNAVAPNTFGYYDEICEFETFFCNQTKKRDSKNPIYKTCDPLDENVLKKFKKCIDNILTDML